MNTRRSSIRLLIAGGPAGGAGGVGGADSAGVAGTAGVDWEDWRAARAESAYAARIAVQRVSRPAGSRPVSTAEPPALPTAQGGLERAVGLGYRESLRWFRPLETPELRRVLLDYAGAVLEADRFPEVPDLLQPFLVPDRDGPDAQTPSPAEGIVFLTHAETDLLALARAELPTSDFQVRGHSLAGASDAEQLLSLIGPLRSPRLAVIARIHGTPASVPGLTELVATADREGWSLVVISGVGTSVDLMPRTAGVTAVFAGALTEYFMAGGAANVAHGIRFAAATLLGARAPYEPSRAMPAHGLYHPDLLVTNPEEWTAHHAPSIPCAWVLFYRAHVLSGNLEFVDSIIRALERRGLAAIGVFTSSLRERDPAGIPLALSVLARSPDIIVNTVAFPVFTLSSVDPSAADLRETPFDTIGAPLLQAICCGVGRQEWSESARGLAPAEAAMNIALPECDGRLIGVPISFKEQHRYIPDPERIDRMATIAAKHSRLRILPNAQKRVAVVLNNVGGKAQRIGAAVGLDTPTSVWQTLQAMRGAGYDVGELPPSGAALMSQLLARGSYDELHPLDVGSAWSFPRADYAQWFHAQSEQLRKAMSDQWGIPQDYGQTRAPPFWRGTKQSLKHAALLASYEPHSDEEAYFFCGLQFGNVLVAIQPPRGYGMDPETMYHAPDLPPGHHYAAFYRWLEEGWGADAVIHFGTHGTLEWLPGKSVALSAACAPDALLGALPLIYPFVVNNPGEGAQAKRRTHATIIDHLVPPLTQAQVYGPLATLARLVEDYYRAEVFDTGKLPILRSQIWELVRSAQLEEDLKQLRLERHGDHTHGWDDRISEAGVPRALEQLSGRGFAHLLEDLDAYLCDLGRAQIRGGLHVFGSAPRGAALVDILFAIMRSPNGSVPSLTDALTRVLFGVDAGLVRDARGVWASRVPPSLKLSEAAGPVTAGQIRVALDELAGAMLSDLAATLFASSGIEAAIERRVGLVVGVASRDSGVSGHPGVPEALKGSEALGGPKVLRDSGALADLRRSLQFVCERLAPDLARTTDETRNLLAALDGKYVPAGPAGSPSRGMAHVLPTGRNFYTVDPRGLPTPAAWTIGAALAEQSLSRHRAEAGSFPESIALSIWGTPTMRTGGDDFAQALALLGVRPLWEAGSRRTSGVEVIPLAELGRPRIDVTLRVSGFFRDAFSGLMALFDEAVGKVAALEESPEDNFVRKHWLAETAQLESQGHSSAAAARLASHRVFSSKPGAYGTGLMQMIDSGDWNASGDLAELAVHSGGWAYGAQNPDGIEAIDAFRRKLAATSLVLHTQDTGEQDLFDSSEVFEYQGGLIAAVTAHAPAAPRAYFSDTSVPANPTVRTLQGQALRAYRSRVVNPKWLQSIQQYGYRGGVEMAGTVDALFGFAATAGIVTAQMFEGVAATYASGSGREFLQQHNPWALNAIVGRLLEAQQRGLWTPKPETLASLQATLLDSEATLEETAESTV
jgi:cobaltochelatase CobN